MSFCLKIEANFRNHLKKLKGANLSVFMVIALHMDAERRSFPGISRISALSGYDRKTVIKSLRVLESLSLIERHKRYHKSTVYRIKGFIHPLFEREDIPLSNNSQGVTFPSSQSQGETASSGFALPEDNTNLYKKKLKGKEKSLSSDPGGDGALSIGQLKDHEKQRAMAEDEQIETLPEEAQRLLEEKAKSLLPCILQNKKFFVRVKMRQLLEIICLTKAKSFDNL